MFRAVGPTRVGKMAAHGELRKCACARYTEKMKRQKIDEKTIFTPRNDRKNVCKMFVLQWINNIKRSRSSILTGVW